MTPKMLCGVKVVGIASAVPPNVIENKKNKNFQSDEIEKIMSSTGVVRRRIVDSSACASDLCYIAAKKLFLELKIDLNDIDIVIFVSQTPDYILPATACVLQDKLGLKKEIMAFDINLGCSGYSYGLILLANLLSTGLYKKALLLAGDTISKIVSPLDRSVAFLFGDAGSATLLEYDASAPPLYFDLGTDGGGFDKLRVEAGSFRFPYGTSVAERELKEGGNCRAKTDLFMNGADIFSFTLREVPKTVSRCLTAANIKKENIDFFFFHQANLFMLNHLIKKMNLAPDKVPISVAEYGNTSVASIPLTMCQQWQAFDQNKTLLVCGFGVGFSWATIILETLNLKVFQPIEMKDIP